MHVSQKGQVTIPKTIRERFGFLPNTEVEFIVEGDTVILRKKAQSSVFRKLKGICKGQFTTDKIMELTRKC